MHERRIAIVAYRPKPGHAAELLELTRAHVPMLRAEGLATDRVAIACEAADGSIVEVFEWEAGAIERAHANPKVMEMWGRYAEVCDYAPLASIEESSNIFAGFTPITL
jgi:hypothetical protein